MFFIISVVLKVLCIVIPVLVVVAYFTLAERKFISSIQRRRGPNVVGVFGLLQPLADGLKLLLKETILPASANTVIFILSPILTFLLSLLSWVVIPLGYGMVFSDLNVGVLYLFAISSLGVYGVIMAGWSSNSKYAFLGALRSAAQMVSYEVSIGFTLVTVLLCSGSLNLTSIVLCQSDIWYCFPLFPVCIVFFISCLAETNRHPFDLPEAEAELVSGYNVEYSAIGFALFFLGEYANMVLISSFTVVLFFGGWLFPFGFLEGSFCFAAKTIIFIALFIVVRAAYPRYRYDQLMRLGWKVFLPISLGWVLLTSGILLGFNWLPLFYKTYTFMLIDLTDFLVVSMVLFIIGLSGIIINRRNIIIVLMSVELMLLAVNLNFIIYSVFLDDLVGQVFALFVLTVAAAESSIGLAILVVYYRIRSTIAMDSINLIHG